MTQMHLVDEYLMLYDFLHHLQSFNIIHLTKLKLPKMCLYILILWTI